MSDANDTPLDTLENLRRRYYPALAAAIEKALRQVDAIDFDRLGPEELIRFLGRLVALEKLILGLSIAVDQVAYHLGPEPPPTDSDAAIDAVTASAMSDKTLESLEARLREGPGPLAAE
jgi:hypothetical protein